MNLHDWIWRMEWRKVDNLLESPHFIILKFPSKFALCHVQLAAYILTIFVMLYPRLPERDVLHYLFSSIVTIELFHLLDYLNVCNRVLLR